MRQPTKDLCNHLKGADRETSSAIIFSTRGQRSLAHELSNGDLDGDEFALIWNEKIVAAFPMENWKAWIPTDLQALSKSVKCPSTPPKEVDREAAAAWHLAKVRHNAGAIGLFANQWLLVAETYGATDERAIELSHRHAMALDVGKSGVWVVTSLPRDLELADYPSHLRSHFPGKSRDRFKKKKQTVLAKLHELDASEQMEPCKLIDLWDMVHPSFGSEKGERYHEMNALLLKWHELYEEYRKAVQARMGTSIGWDEKKLYTFKQLVQEYRDKFLNGYSDDQLRFPPEDSKILAEAAAIYMVNYKLYQARISRPDWRPVSLGFAWSVAGDFLFIIKYHQSSKLKTNARGAVPVYDPLPIIRLLMGTHNQRNALLSRRSALLNTMLDSKEEYELDSQAE